MADWTDFWVQSGAGAVGGLVGFVFAYLLFRAQRSADQLAAKERLDAEATAESERLANERKALLTYLAGEVRANRDFMQSMKNYADRVVYYAGMPTGDFDKHAYIGSGLTDQAYRVVAPRREAGIANDATLRDLLVSAYSGVAVWRGLERFVEQETGSRDKARIFSALVRLNQASEAIPGQVHLFQEVLLRLGHLGIEVGDGTHQPGPPNPKAAARGKPQVSNTKH